MSQRLTARACALALLVPGCFFNANGQAQGDAKDNGNGNASNNANGNGSGNASGNANGNSNTTAAVKEGTWDISTIGAGSLGPSEMVVTASAVSGFIATAAEGKSDPKAPDCVCVKDRTEFSLTASANTMTGSITAITEWVGSGCRPSSRDSLPLAGTRIVVGTGSLDGTWDVKSTDQRPFAATVQVSIQSGIATATSTQANLQFAARKR